MVGVKGVGGGRIGASGVKGVVGLRGWGDGRYWGSRGRMGVGVVGVKGWGLGVVEV